MTKKKQLIGTAITAALVSASVGVLALGHPRPEGALFLELFAVVALAVAIRFLAIIFGNSKPSVGDAVTARRRYRRADATPNPTDTPTIPLANPATGLPLVRGASFDVGGNLYQQPRSPR